MSNDKLDDQRAEWLAELAADLRKETSPHVRSEIKRTIAEIRNPEIIGGITLLHRHRCMHCKRTWVHSDETCSGKNYSMSETCCARCI